jgi:hypothetical protein
MNNPTLEEVVALLDNSNESIVGGNSIQLQAEFGLENLIPQYIEAFYRIRNWPGRMHIVHYLVRYAKKHPEIIELGLYGLKDKSRIVRYYCCAILAFAGQKQHIPFLDELTDHKNINTRRDARAALDAITNSNHHLFADRDHSGRVFWEP